MPSTRLNETIAALCSPPGGAIAVIRLSGPNALQSANKIWKGLHPLSTKTARTLHLGLCGARGDKDGDPTLAVFMPGPNSYTGEDVVELHCHGGAVVAKETLGAIIAAGARHAKPGEFTLRAFLNGKMDLTQAEAVCDIINAQTSAALHLAERQMSGALGGRIESIRKSLLDILAECESRMDFCEEDLDWAPPAEIARKTAEIAEALSKLVKSRADGAIIRDGLNVVIAGRPNSGKSSLLNLLLGFGRAIVTETPGTTRDTLEEAAVIRNIPVKLIDTAGIRDADNAIERIGIGKSIESLERAGIILWLLDASSKPPENEVEVMTQHVETTKRLLAVWNKIDLLDPGEIPRLPRTNAAETVQCSVIKEQGVEQLLDAVERLAWGGAPHPEPEIAVNARHAELVDNAIAALNNAPGDIRNEEWEIAALNLRSAAEALGVITGETATPDVLDNIFSRFCVGK